jgi:hypothetical protein
MPDEMFENVRLSLPRGNGQLGAQEEFIWPLDSTMAAWYEASIEALSAPIKAILAREDREIQNIRFTISHGYVLPNFAQRPKGESKEGNWHKDGSIADGVHRYATADCLPTEFFGRSTPRPGELVRFDRRLHRSPTNLAGVPIYRTWIRAAVLTVK